MAEGLWARFIEAVRRHDDGWIESEKRPALDRDGRLHDFKSLPVPLHVEVWRRSVDLARRADPYQGLLVAQHARRLYAEFFRDVSGEDQRLARDFIAEMDRAIDACTASEREDLLASRPLLSFFDGLSLRLLGAIAMDRTELLPFGNDEAVLAVTEEKGGVRVQPWPFAAEAVSLDVRGVRLDASRFGSPDDLAVALARAPAETLRFELKGPMKDE